MIQTPKKISPDRIKSALVEIRFIPTLPYEIALGQFFDALDDSYQYNSEPQKINIAEELKQITIKIGGLNYFRRNGIVIQYSPPASFFFNIEKPYMGWETYRDEIENFLEQIKNVKAIGLFSRVGLRYISEYESTELTNCVNFSFNIGIPDFNSKSFRFNSEYIRDNSRIVVNLLNNIPHKVDSQITITSIDIDVIQENLSIGDVKDLMHQVDLAHTLEKECFFTLLKKDFLKTLNPEY